jgi:hypothetical protein
MLIHRTLLSNSKRGGMYPFDTIESSWPPLSRQWSESRKSSSSERTHSGRTGTFILHPSTHVYTLANIQDVRKQGSSTPGRCPKHRKTYRTRSTPQDKDISYRARCRLGGKREDQGKNSSQGSWKESHGGSDLEGKGKGKVWQEGRGEQVDSCGRRWDGYAARLGVGFGLWYSFGVVRVDLLYITSLACFRVHPQYRYGITITCHAMD